MIHAKGSKTTVGTTSKIRVIKKGQTRKVKVPTFVNKQSKNEVARRMVATVMNWVSDFETRKLEETGLAIERFQHM